MMVEKKEIETKKNNTIEKKEDTEFIKKMFAPDATQEEFRLFLELSKRYNLDPFKRQIFLIKNKKRPNEPATIMVSHAGMLHLAHESGKFGGMETYVITKDGKTALICNQDEIAGAVCYVYRTDWNKPLMHAVSLKEYYRKMPPGYKNIWDEKRITMIKKVAEAGALRRAFDTGGLYTEDEMDTNYVSTEVEYEEKTEESTKQSVKKELPKNNMTLLALLKRIEEVEERFGLKNIRKTLEKKIGKSIEKFSEPQLKQAINAVDKLEAKKIQESMYTDADFIEEEPAQPEEFQELGKPDDVDTIEQRLKEINEIFDD
jgi:phage recombination protein Bet